MHHFVFEVLIEKEPDDAGYYAYSPLLPGCFADGKTIEEAQRNMYGAIAQHLAALRAHGKHIPQHEHPLVHVERLTLTLPA